MPRIVVAFLFLIVAMAASEIARADPPAHAPAHGWRKKHDPAYVGYTGTKWERDYEVASGSCNREEIGAVIGSVIGGGIAARNSTPENRTVAVIIGAAAGALIGSRIGRALDDADRGCFGHVMEIGVAGRPVKWSNPTTGVNFTLVPGEGRRVGGKSCRQYTLTSARGAVSEKKTGEACQTGIGVWSLAGT
jgi:surface antigen